MSLLVESRGARLTVVLLTSAITSIAALAAADYLNDRDTFIQWDCGTIERIYGGETEEDRLLEIKFIKKWEYKALKKSQDGEPVWLHLKLTQRHCGNWMLADPDQASLIRPVELRFPNGVPPRHGFDCFGNATYR